MTALTPQYSISVVLAVYQGADAVRKTVNSIINQACGSADASNCVLELDIVIVDDGADHSCKNVLSDLMSNNECINVITQDNQGLTKALIVGCEAARFDLIARIDVGDEMLPGRLVRQAEYLDSHQGVGVVASWTHIVTEEGDKLYDVSDSNDIVQRTLSLDELESARAPQHYTTMFNKELYQKVGGYRSQFYFAQDMDLWLRLYEVADVVVMEDYLTSSVFSANAISGTYNKQQDELMHLAMQSAKLRRAGKSDETVLLQAEQIRPIKMAGTDGQFNTLYFIAKCLLPHKPDSARRYFWRALGKKPMSIKAGFGLLQAYWRAKIKTVEKKH